MFKKFQAAPVMAIVVMTTLAVYGVCFAIKVFAVQSPITIIEQAFNESRQVKFDTEDDQPRPMFMSEQIVTTSVKGLNLLTLNKLSESECVAQMFIKLPWQDNFDANSALDPFNFALSSTFEDLYDFRFEAENKKVFFNIIAIENCNCSEGFTVKGKIRKVEGELETTQLQNFFDESANKMYEMILVKLSNIENVLEDSYAYDEYVDL
jgi:hypothetical protein